MSVSDRVFFIGTRYKKRDTFLERSKISPYLMKKFIRVGEKPGSEFRNRVRSVPVRNGHGGFPTVFRSVYFYPVCNGAIDVPDEMAGRE